MSRLPKRPSGFTLIETTIILLVAGIILGGIYGAYNYVQNRSKVETTKQSILKLTNNFRDVMAAKSPVSRTTVTGSNAIRTEIIGQLCPTGYATTNAGLMKCLYDLNVFPKEMRCDTDGTGCRTPYGDVIVDMDFAYNRIYTLKLRFPDLPKNACLSLLPSLVDDDNTATTNGILAVGSNGTIINQNTVIDLEYINDDLCDSTNDVVDNVYLAIPAQLP